MSRPGATPKPRRVTTITFDDPVATPDAQAPLSTETGAAGSGTQYSEDNDERGGASRDVDTAASTACHRVVSDDPDAIKPIERTRSAGRSRYRPSNNPEGHVLQAARSIEKVAASAFVLGDARPPRPRSRSRSRSTVRQQNLDLPALSRQVTVGRNSNFYNMSEMDRERLGGIEYRALKLLLKFVFGTYRPLQLNPFLRFCSAAKPTCAQRLLLRPPPARCHLSPALDS